MLRKVSLTCGELRVEVMLTLPPLHLFIKQEARQAVADNRLLGKLWALRLK
jgi:hypothetical protein